MLPSYPVSITSSSTPTAHNATSFSRVWRQAVSREERPFLLRPHTAQPHSDNHPQNPYNHGQLYQPTYQQGYRFMDTNTSQTIHTAVTDWARAKFHTDEIVIADIDPDDEPEQYLVVLAARPLAYWLAVEVWLRNGQVETINDLGGGVPLVEQAWPWSEDGR